MHPGPRPGPPGLLSATTLSFPMGRIRSPVKGGDPGRPPEYDARSLQIIHSFRAWLVAAQHNTNTALLNLMCVDRRYGVDLREVELPGDKEDHRANRGEAAIAARLAPGRLEESIQGFQEPIGGARLRPCDDCALEKALPSSVHASY